MIKFQIEGRPISWNFYYAQRHWSARQAKSLEWKWRVKAALMKYHVPRAALKHAVSIEFVAYVKRPIDCDNICIKVIIDGLREWGLLQDDTPAWVKQISISVRTKSDLERIEVEVNE